MEITDTDWEMTCASIEQKQELFDYAAARGVRAFPRRIEPQYRDNEDLAIGYWREGSKYGLMAVPASGPPDDATLFRKMCD